MKTTANQLKYYYTKWAYFLKGLNACIFNDSLRKKLLNFTMFTL